LTLPGDHVFGLKNDRDSFDAGKLVSQDYPTESKPKKIIQKLPLNPKIHDKNAVFGVPTIRKDIQPPKYQRFGDFQVIFSVFFN
jgi:hypothetical protein